MNCLLPFVPFIKPSTFMQHYNHWVYYVSNGKDEGFSEESDCVKLSINALPMPGWLPWLLPRIAVTSSSVPPFLSLPLS